MPSAGEWIEALGLTRHPEGGWFRETYRAAEGVAREHLPARFTGPRAFATSIYYLLEEGDLSALHRIRQDEAWYFHEGGPLEIQLISPDGKADLLRLGRNPGAGESPQAVAPAGWLFGARVVRGGLYTLCGCSVSPGFDFEDFELPSRQEVLAAYPHLAEVVTKFTR
jgi:predicted cupin superfamily sugar epimerase